MIKFNKYTCPKCANKQLQAITNTDTNNPIVKVICDYCNNIELLTNILGSK